MTLTPTLLWAQTKDDLYLTVELSKPSDLKVDLTDEAFKFYAKKDGNVYEFDFKFFKPVKSSDYKTKDQRFLEFKVPKSEPESWTTLNSCGKKHYIKCNWDKWVDSDAEADDLNDGFDMPNFGDFGDLDMNGMGDMDDEMDDLEETDNEETDARSPDCKNPNCQCNPCKCTPDNQCSEGTSKSLSKEDCCGKSECHPKGAEDSCCATKNCSEKCPC
uniref:CS domain containing protein, putative n=1 Tax=Theileria annulata TaxID=5874 RepID=A0A3B0N961_THEAN